MKWSEYKADKEYYNKFIARVTKEEFKPFIEKLVVLIEAQNN